MMKFPTPAFLLPLLATTASAFVAVPTIKPMVLVSIGAPPVKRAEFATTGTSRCFLPIKMSDEEEPDANGRPSSNWKDYRYSDMLPYKRKKGFQNIEWGKSRTGTTEFLIVSKSNGNSSGTRRKAQVKGGGWGSLEAPVYAGNDDRCVEIWSRDVKTNQDKKDLGMIDIRNGAGAMVIVAYKKGYIEMGKTVEIKATKKTKVEVDNRGKKPWLVAAVADNGKGLDYSKIADETFGPKKDDPCFLYLTTEKNFEDKTCGKIRGAIASIELK